MPDEPASYMPKVRGGSDTWIKWDGSIGTGGKGALTSKEVAFTLSATQDQMLMQGVDDGKYIVRRLTPRETERLQGFPDDWTKVPYRGKPAEECPDTPRYKAMGNSMSTTVMRMLGRRIEAFDTLHYDEVGLQDG